MHEYGGGRPEYENPFKDTWDEFDFTELVAKDPAWSIFYNDDYGSVEELEAEELERMALEFIGTPEFADHVIGYTFYRTTSSVWPSIGGLHERLLPYRFAVPPESVRAAVVQTMRQLVLADILQIGARQTFFAGGPNMPLDKFPCLGEEFEQQVIDFLEKCGGEAVGKNIIFSIFGDAMGPYEFWAAQRKLVEMREAGQVVREHGRICLIRHESVWSKAMHATIESVFASDNPPEKTSPLTKQQLEHRMRQLGYTGAQRLVKPKQRTRGQQ